MGLPMNNLHAPTVASGPTSSPSSNGDSSNKSLFELMNERDRVRDELSALGSVLESHAVDMQTPLLTPDGFPRADIDVAQIRTTRARIVRLKNDYKGLMDQIEKGLHEHHANLSTTEQSSAHTLPSRAAPATSGSQSTGPTSIEAPFAKVNSVVNSSPADAAGLKAGDKITKFGYVNWMNHEKLSKVAQVVQQNEGRPILVKLVRGASEGGGSEQLEVQLIPRHNWGGRGMLGCHLLPL